MKTAFINGIILDCTENMEPLKDKVLIVEDEKISGIYDKNHDLSDCQMVDLKGRYLMAGLINMHVHLAGNGKPQKKQRDNKKLVDTIFAVPGGAAVARKLHESWARLELLSGVTTVRTVGGLRTFDTELRDAINNGKKVGPRILAGNEGITVVGGHMEGSVARAAHNNEEAVAMVDRLAKEKTDLVKVMITGGVMDAKVKGAPGEIKMPAEMVKAVCERAKEHGLYVSAHVESPEGVKLALENGVTSIEHGAKPDEETIRLFKEKKAFLITTLSPALPYALFDPAITNVSEVEQFNGKVVFDGIIECSKTALANGIPVGLGNDVGCPWVSAYDFWRELVYFHNYVGVSNKFALYTATLRNAQLAGIDKITGSLEAGKYADMIVTENNPLDDLKTLQHVQMVVHKGHVIDHPQYKRKAILDQELGKFI